MTAGDSDPGAGEVYTLLHTLATADRTGRMTHHGQKERQGAAFCDSDAADAVLMYVEPHGA